MRSRIVTDKDAGMVEAILAMEQLFPKKIGYGEWDVWDNLQNLNNMNIIAENDNGDIIGYILCIPQNEAVEYLKEDDPVMEKSEDMVYVDQIAVARNEREGEHVVFKFLVEALSEEAKKRGVKKWSSHLVMGINLIIGQMYSGRVVSQRRLKMVKYGNYPLVYMVGFV
ncbi:MAG: hypothetical protein WCF93_01125 [Candidatus Moraniibacteriota bacterium]